jgi:hypothetical protein
MPLRRRTKRLWLAAGGHWRIPRARACFQQGERIPKVHLTGGPVGQTCSIVGHVVGPFIIPSYLLSNLVIRMAWWMADTAENILSIDRSENLPDAEPSDGCFFSVLVESRGT